MADKLPKEIEALMADMVLPSGVPKDAKDSIRSAIASSPYLQTRMLEQIKDGELSKIGIGHSEGSWGFFQDESKTANIDSQLFKDLSSALDVDLEDAITYVLGHEVGHSNIAAQRKLANETLGNDMKSAYWTADRPDNMVDITKPIEKYVRFAGTDETRAEIEAWNALASRVDQEKDGPVNTNELIKRAEPISAFVDKDKATNQITLVNGVTIENGPYLSYLSPSDNKTVSENAKGISGVFFTPELQARYAAQGIGVAAAWSKAYDGPEPYQTGVDFNALKLTPKMIEDAGLNLDGQGKTFNVTDTSNGGRNWITLKQTRDEKNLSPHALPDRPNQLEQDQPGKPYFDQALIALNASPNLKNGSLSEDDKKRAAMGLAQAALGADPPLSRIDHVVVGKGENPNFFAVQGDLHDPAHLRAHLPANQAVQTNVDQGMTQLNQLAVQRQQEQTQAFQQQQSVQQTPNNPSQRMGGP